MQLKNSYKCQFRLVFHISHLLAAALFSAGLTISNFAQQPGDLDPTFDHDGWRVDTTVPGRGSDYGKVVLVQSDGKIVTVGESENGGNACSITRHLTDGTLDASFGSGGKILTSPNCMVAAAALQGDDKLVIATNSNLIRYNPDGSLDTTFMQAYTNAASLVIQGDGKIIAAGTYYYNCIPDEYCNYGFALSRYNSDGSQDSTFGGGLVTTQIGIDSYPNAVAIQSDGKIVAAGWSDAVSGGSAIVRYNVNGSLDASFGNGGIATYQTSAIRAVVLQTDGKIVAAGDFGLARYNSNSALDSSFGTGGIITIAPGSNYAVSIQPDGKIVAMTSSLLRRYNANGTPDTSFGTGER